MFDELECLLSTQNATIISANQTNLDVPKPFKNHVEFSILVDSLIRKNRHHLILEIDFSKKLFPLWLEALLNYLAEDHIPYPLHGVSALYLNNEPNTYILHDEKRIKAQKTDNAFEENKYVLIAFSDSFLSSADESLSHQLKFFYDHPSFRLILFKTKNTNDLPNLQTNYLNLLKENENEWRTFLIASPHDDEMISILKEQRVTLEKFHQVIIPDDIIKEAYSLAGKYLNARNLLEQSLLLLDTSAAHAKSYQLGQAHHPQMKTILTLKTMQQVLSNWTKIPATHLSSSHFKFTEFMERMKQEIIGQDPALTLLGQEIQQSQSTFTMNESVFGAYLFAGPSNVGKKTCARVLADYLFKSNHMLYVAESFTPQLTSLIDLRFKCDGECLKMNFSHAPSGKYYTPLKTVIENCPYAILIFDEIEKCSPLLLNSLVDLVSSGYLEDQCGNLYNFRHAILIFTTTLGTNHIVKLNKSVARGSKPDHIDLVELVMSEKKQTSISDSPFSPQELIEEIMPEINNHLPASLCQTLQIIPFLPLTIESIQTIMRSKLNALSHSLLQEHRIHFNYAHEVLQYLAKGALKLKQDKVENHEWEIDNILKKLHATIRHAIQLKTSHSHDHCHLLLQLNETGTLLRCEWKRESVKRDDKTT